MKKLILLGLSIVLFIACKQNEPQRFTTSSPEIDATKSFIKAYEEGDWKTWEGLYSDTAKIYHNTWDIPATVAETLESHKAILSNFSSYQFVKDPIFYEMIIDDDGNKWVHFWGVWKGVLSANGKELKIPVHLAVNYVDGKNTEEYGFWDRSPLLDALTEIAESEMENHEDGDPDE